MPRPDPKPRMRSRLYQCPGCWAFGLQWQPADYFECDCGERLTCVDLRGGEASRA